MYASVGEKCSQWFAKLDLISLWFDKKLLEGCSFIAPFLPPEICLCFPLICMYTCCCDLVMWACGDRAVGCEWWMMNAAECAVHWFGVSDPFFSAVCPATVKAHNCALWRWVASWSLNAFQHDVISLRCNGILPASIYAATCTVAGSPTPGDDDVVVVGAGVLW
jgi:hypothetical protein